jgi:hypothetical protein
MSQSISLLEQAQQLTMAQQKLTLKVLAPEDEPAFLKLHQEVFGSSADPVWFDWKYKLGKAVGMSLWFEDRMVAHCGGIPRTVLHQGVKQQDLQIGDVMVSPEWRGALTRQNPFFHVSEGLYQSFLGGGKTFHMGFGFPNERHLRLAVKLGIGWRIGEVHQLRWDVRHNNAPTQLGWLWQDETLSSVNADGQAVYASLAKEVTQAWHGMQADANSLRFSVGQRDWAQFEWRYLHRPDKQYQFVALKRPWSSKCIGIAVLSAPADKGAAMLWVDWIGPTHLMPLAHRMVMKQAHIQQASCVTCWASAEVERELVDSHIDAIETCAVMGVPIASNLTAEQAQNLRWWAMAGDTDFL